MNWLWFGIRKQASRLAVLVLAATLGLATSSGARAQDLAQMQVQITQLQEQVRQYTGQIEGLQFQLTQLQELLGRMQEDYELRFNQLEGGDLTPAPQPGTPAPAAPSGDEARLDPSVPTVIDPLMGDEDLMTGEEMGGDDDLYATDVFGPNGAPTLGSPPAPLGQTQPSAPLDLSLDANGNANASGGASAQFQAAYNAVVSGDYAFAEEQFREFVAENPSSAQAPDATYWLGESLIRRNAYDEAANVLLTGFETYPTSSRAPDLLFKLGVALHGAGEFDTACRTYSEVLRRYPEASAAFREDVTSEQARAGC